jgi:hypothetical protein
VRWGYGSEPINHTREEPRVAKNGEVLSLPLLQRLHPPLRHPLPRIQAQRGCPTPPPQRRPGGALGPSPLSPCL